MSRLTLTRAVPQSAGAITRVPLDISTALPDRGRYDALVVRIHDMPYGASLSKGHNNGDRSWTVTTEQLAGLFYMPSLANFEAHALICRIIGIIDGEEAVVLEQFELEIAPDGRTPEVPQSDANTGVLVQFGRVKAWAEGASWARQTDNRAADRDVLAAVVDDRITELAKRLEEAETHIAALTRAAREAHARLADVESDIEENRVVGHLAGAEPEPSAARMRINALTGKPQRTLAKVSAA
ncbi:MAG: hypothetical protein O7C63_05725 [Alphaproteobacteria bacterium]|nr:hypothetical protein [Alphaproteobacteria bacterium]